MVIGRPVVIRAEFRVSTDELVKDLERRYGQVKLASWTRMPENTGGRAAAVVDASGGDRGPVGCGSAVTSRVRIGP